MKTIVWDVDDVLNDLMRVWLEKKWLPDHPDCKVGYEDIIANPPEKILQAPRAEYEQSLDAFRCCPGYLEMKPNQEVLTWFKEYGPKARHLVLTAVPLIRADISAAWVTKNFGTWIRSFNFVPSKRKANPIPEYDQTKQDFLKWFGKADVFVEDTEKNIVGLEDLGIKPFLISRPWNKSEKTMTEVLAQITKVIEEND